MIRAAVALLLAAPAAHAQSVSTRTQASQPQLELTTTERVRKKPKKKDVRSTDRVKFGERLTPEGEREERNPHERVSGRLHTRIESRINNRLRGTEKMVAGYKAAEDQVKKKKGVVQ